MIWVELLTRHRDVSARFRINAREFSIGRGYDNDIIVDDSYVAARHVRVFHDEAGQLVAEDLGSANGMYLDARKGKRSRLARTVVDGNVPIRIGQTLIRIRETSHAVEHERPAGSTRRFAPLVAAVALGLGLLGFGALSLWLAQTSEPHLSDYLVPLVTLIGIALGWIGLWSLLSRLFSGQSRFLRHVVIAEVAVLAFWIYDELAQVSAFSLTSPVAYGYEYIAAWLAFARDVLPAPARGWPDASRRQGHCRGCAAGRRPGGDDRATLGGVRQIGAANRGACADAAGYAPGSVAE
jgi:hypothetical protein